jgi:hypothetical protein
MALTRAVPVLRVADVATSMVTRRLERMPYGLAEFEITDPDGYVLCIGQALDDADDLPTPEL